MPPVGIPVPLADLECFAQLVGSALRGRLAAVELWRGTALLGTLSGETVESMIRQHLSTALIVQTMHQDLAAPPVPVEPLPLLRPHPPKPLPRPNVLSPTAKAVRRAARRARSA